MLASASQDQTVKIWNVADGSLIRTLNGHTFSVFSVAFSPDGTKLVSGAGDNTAKVWNVSTGATLFTYTGHSFFVVSVAFLPNGTDVASGSWDQTTDVWRASDGLLLHHFSGTEAIYGVAVSPDGQRLAASFGDGPIRLWNIATEQLLATMIGQTAPNVLDFSTDGATLISGGFDSTIRVWSVPSGALRKTLGGHSGSVHAVRFAPDESALATGSIDSTIRFWNGADGSAPAPGSAATIAPGSLGIQALDYSPDGSLLAVGIGSDDSDPIVLSLRLYDSHTGALVRTMAGHNRGTFSVDFSPDGLTVVSGGTDFNGVVYHGTIKLWRVSDGALLQTIFHSLVAGQRVASVEFAPSGASFASASTDSTAKTWAFPGGAPILTFNHGGALHSLSYSFDGLTLGTAGEFTGGGGTDCAIRLWQVSDATLLHTLLGHETIIHAIDISPDGTLLISVSGFDRTVRLWSVADGKLLQTYDQETGTGVMPNMSVAFSPTGTRFAYGRTDATVVVAQTPAFGGSPADLNGDGVVDGFDLALLLGAWGQCLPKAPCPADLDGNGFVNGLDLTTLLAAWTG
jgi:WD40 repeat protein